MEGIQKEESPIIRLTHWSVELTLPKKGSAEIGKHGDTTVYGVDEEGNERVYARISSQHWEEWSKTDPLWKQALSDTHAYLLSNPKTRDFMIKLYLKTALEKGDDEMSLKLLNALSASTREELMAGLPTNTSTEEIIKRFALSDVQKEWVKGAKHELSPSELEKLIIKQKGRCALSGAFLVFINRQEIHPLYASLDHFSSSNKKEKHRLVCYALKDCKC